MCKEPYFYLKQYTTNGNTAKNSFVVLTSVKLCTKKYNPLLVFMRISGEEVLYNI